MRMAATRNPTVPPTIKPTKKNHTRLTLGARYNVYTMCSERISVASFVFTMVTRASRSSS